MSESSHFDPFLLTELPREYVQIVNNYAGDSEELRAAYTTHYMVIAEAEHLHRETGYIPRDFFDRYHQTEDVVRSIRQNLGLDQQV